MTRVCEKYRERALQDGLNSKAGEIWRRHSSNCPCCRAEIYLLSILGESVSDSRQHIRRKDYERLLQEVREHSVGGHSFPGIGIRRSGWNLHTAAHLAAVFLVMFFIAVSGSWSSYHLWETDSDGTVMEQLSTMVGREGLFTGSGSFVVGETPGIYSVPENAEGLLSDSAEDGSLGNSSLDRVFFDLRNDIEDQRLFYSGMIDRELHE